MLIVKLRETPQRSYALRTIFFLACIFPSRVAPRDINCRNSGGIEFLLNTKINIPRLTIGVIASTMRRLNLSRHVLPHFPLVKCHLSNFIIIKINLSHCVCNRQIQSCNYVWYLSLYLFYCKCLLYQLYNANWPSDVWMNHLWISGTRKRTIMIMNCETKVKRKRDPSATRPRKWNLYQRPKLTLDRQTARVEASLRELLVLGVRSKIPKSITTEIRMSTSLVGSLFYATKRVSIINNCVLLQKIYN